MNNYKRYAPWLLVVLVGAAIVWYVSGTQRTSVNLDTFAQCLAEKGVTMYGADWCPHCQNEKRAFGPSFKYVPYVECPDDPQRCIDAGITGYPTWVLPDGQKLLGEQGIEKLSQESGCPLPTE